MSGPEFWFAVLWGGSIGFVVGVVFMGFVYESRRQPVAGRGRPDPLPLRRGSGDGRRNVKVLADEKIIRRWSE